MKSKAAKDPQKNEPAFDGVASLAELALNLHWTWNHATDELWKRLDAELWQATQIPRVVLQTISKDTLHAALAEPEFRQRLNSVLQHNRETSPAETRFEHLQACSRSRAGEAVGISLHRQHNHVTQIAESWD